MQNPSQTLIKDQFKNVWHYCNKLRWVTGHQVKAKFHNETKNMMLAETTGGWCELSALVF